MANENGGLMEWLTNQLQAVDEGPANAIEQEMLKGENYMSNMIDMAVQFDRDAGWAGWEDPEELQKLSSFLGDSDTPWVTSPSGMLDDPEQLVLSGQYPSYNSTSGNYMKDYEVHPSLTDRVSEKLTFLREN